MVAGAPTGRTASSRPTPVTLVSQDHHTGSGCAPSPERAIRNRTHSNRTGPKMINREGRKTGRIFAARRHRFPSGISSRKQEDRREFILPYRTLISCSQYPHHRTGSAVRFRPYSGRPESPAFRHRSSRCGHRRPGTARAPLPPCGHRFIHGQRPHPTLLDFLTCPCIAEPAGSPVRFRSPSRVTPAAAHPLSSS